MNILLIRHGQTDWNTEGRLQGTENIPLNHTGRDQAKACAESLMRQNWDAIFTSPLSRASETAYILSEGTNHPPVVTEPLLIEREFGQASGITWHELKTRYPLYPKEIPEGMEPFDKLCSRMEQAVRNCMAKSSSGNIILVSHGGSINALLYHLSSGTIGTGITFLKNTCISILDFDHVLNQLFIREYNLSGEEYLRL